MTTLPDLLAGAITSEYGELSFGDAPAQEDPTDTCGSQCSGRDCNDETCLAQEEPEESRRKAHKAFVPVVEGWNEPPAIYR